MRLKSYFASTVEAAMALARQELGGDAMLVHSRRATPDTRYLGEYEVVFAAAPAEEAAPGSEPAAMDNGRGPLPPSTVDRLSEQLHNLKQQIERLSTNFTRSRVRGTIESPWDAAAAQTIALLTGAGVHDEIACEIALRVAEDGSGEAHWPRILEQMIPFDSSLGRPGRQRRVVALVGPPGSGKTTTLVKLAAQYALTARKPALVLSADFVRIAASDQLRSYAAILGLSFQAVETPRSLLQALDEHRHKDLIFIDTPGLAERDLSEAAGLAEVIGGQPEIDVQLIVPASMRPSDLVRIGDRYRMFQPAKLIFTKLDETDCPGVIVNEAVRTGLPVAFLAGGQQIPEDLDPAALPMLTALLSGGSSELCGPGQMVTTSQRGPR